MAQPPPSAHIAGQGIIVPDDTRKKYPELIDLILGSESMNNEERQYWINILPIMTPDQIENLQSILTNEREQLAAIDRKYATAVNKIGQEQLVKRTGERRRERREKLHAAESQEEQSDEEREEELLKEIERM